MRGRQRPRNSKKSAPLRIRYTYPTTTTQYLHHTTTVLNRRHLQRAHAALNFALHAHLQQPTYFYSTAPKQTHLMTLIS